MGLGLGLALGLGLGSGLGWARVKARLRVRARVRLRVRVTLPSSQMAPTQERQNAENKPTRMHQRARCGKAGCSGSHNTHCSSMRKRAKTDTASRDTKLPGGWVHVSLIVGSCGSGGHCDCRTQVV